MRTFTNSYQRPKVEYPHDVHLHTPLEDYDYNFMYDVKTLSSDRVEVRPFLPSRDAQALLDGVKANPALLDFIGPKWETLNDICMFMEEARRNPAQLRHAIYTAPLDRLDAPKSEYVLAGTVSLIESNYENMMSEVGWLVILTPFQRTHVMTHAVGLLMKRVLDSVDEGGLGLRRCQWKCHSMNEKSKASAVRLGYVPEGTIRAWVVVPQGRPSIHDGRPGRLQESGQRDTWMSGITWYEWEEGKREHIEQLMARRK